MVIRFLCQFLFVLCLLLCGSDAVGQTIFAENFNEGNGAMSGQDNISFTPWSTNCGGCLGSGFTVVGNSLEARDTDGVTTFTTDPIDVSRCSQIQVSMDYNATSYVAGAEMLDDYTECMVCAGDPETPSAGGCDNCWDFSLVEVFYDRGIPDRLALFGRGENPGATRPINEQSRCLGDATEATLVIQVQNNLPDEFVRFSNIMVVCIEPEPGPALITDKVNYCEGETVNASTVALSGASYNWFLDDVPLAGTSAAVSFTADNMLGSSQSLEYISILSSGCKETAFRNILVNAAPTVTLSPPMQTVCEGEAFNITASSISSISSYDWSVPGTTSQIASTFNEPSAELTDNGMYTVTARIAGVAGCEGQASATVIVLPSTYMIDISTSFCENDTITPLSTTQDGVDGAWSGAGVSGNMFDPSLLPVGSHDLTFTPNVTTCLGAMTHSVTIAAVPISNPTSGSLVSCGTTMATFDLTSQDAMISAGSGLAVMWYEDTTLSTMITDPAVFESDSTTVYAVINNGTCNSEIQQLELRLSAGPQIMMPDTILTCDSVVLNPIVVVDGSGNDEYYSLSDGRGAIIPVGTIFYEDTVVYAYEAEGACVGEQRIEILVEQSTSAGPDQDLTICASGMINLLEYVHPSAGSGNFQDGIGNPITNNMLLAEDYYGVSLQVIYETTSSGSCSSDQAHYLLSASPVNDAGPDSTARVCIFSTVDLRTLTFDNGAAGVFESMEGEVLIALDTIPTSNNPNIDVNYIVATSAQCEPDTAKILVRSELQLTRTITGEYCNDEEIMIAGIPFNAANFQDSYTVSSNGFCDSLITIDLQFRPENRVQLSRVLCVGQEYPVGDVLYSSNFIGEQIIKDGDRFGCDSIIELDLEFNTEINVLLDFTLCAGQDTLINGKIYTVLDSEGETTLQSSTGCDSIVSVDLNFAQSSESLFNGTGIYCPLDTVIIEGEIFDLDRQDGMFLSQFRNAVGCDSFIVVDLEFDTSNNELIDRSVCSDMTISVNGNSYGADRPEGREVVSILNQCDSVYFIDLTILQADTILIEETFCNDTSIVVNNVVYDRFRSGGEEIVPGASVSGCNQYVFIDLDYIESYRDTLSYEFCNDEFIRVNGVLYDRNNTNGTEFLQTDSGCDSLVTIALTFKGPDVIFSDGNTDCADGTGRLLIDIVGGEEQVQDVYLDNVSVYEPGEFSILLTGLDTGKHIAYVLSEEGCSNSYTFTVGKFQEQTITIQSDRIGDEYYQLDIEFSGEASSAQWTPSEGLSCTDCENPEARPGLSSLYTVSVIDVNGCTYTENIQLEFLIESVFYQPNVFSPNRDGVNDVFYLYSRENFEYLNFSIFDRWGNQVFRKLNGRTGNPEDGWDGAGQDPGVFIYFMELDFPDGVETISGEFSLIR